MEQITPKNRLILLVVLMVIGIAGLGYNSYKMELATTPLQTNLRGYTATPTPFAGPLNIYPRKDITTGAINPNITQANINQTICNKNWTTKTIRPPTSYTNPLKIKQIAEYGFTDKDPKNYEEDHLISLELGGNPTDPQNLWPESYTITPNAKDKDLVENFLHNQVCAGKMTLKEAQDAIVNDWYKVYMDNNLGRNKVYLDNLAK